MPDFRHPVFGRLYTVISQRTEKRVGPHRDRALAHLSGRVVEVGSGNGLNFRHYPDAVEKVIAVEPESYMRTKSLVEAERAAVDIEVRDGLADRLPVEDSWADAVLFALVLCTVPDQSAALAEATRVLRPGGQIVLFEHVISESPRAARAQHLVNPVWSFVGGGCNCDRDTLAAVRAAGYRIESISRFPFRPSWPAAAVTPHLIATARRPE